MTESSRRLRAWAGAFEWRTGLTAALNASAALLVLVAALVARTGAFDVPVSTLLAVSAVWGVLALWCALRKRLSDGEAITQLCAIESLLLLQAVVVGDPLWTWVCALTLSMVPVSGVLFLRGPRLVALTAVVAAGQAVVALQVVDRPQLVAFFVVTLVSCSAVPVVVIGVLARAVRALQAESALQARTDLLTGLLNRRGMGEGAEALLRRAARSGSVVGVVLADLDGFKAVNDTWGHTVGDDVLVAAAAALRAEVRSGDLVVRLGGEELAVVGCWEDEAAVAASAERLRAAVERLRSPGLPPVTISVGTATTSATSTSAAVEAAEGHPGGASDLLSHLIDRADQALYEAKRAGRNCVRRSSAHEVPAQGPAAGPRIGA